MMKISPSFYRIAIALIVGLVLVLFPQNAADYLVIAVGVIFMLPSVIRIVTYFTAKGKSAFGFPVDGLGGFLFGLMLVIMPGFFGNILTILLGFILTMAGVQQISSLIAARRWTVVPVWSYIVPVIILLAGIFSLTNPVDVRATLFKIIGSFFLVYAIIELCNWFFFQRKRPQYGNIGAQSGQSILEKMGVDEEDVEDVEFEEEN